MDLPLSTQLASEWAALQQSCAPDARAVALRLASDNDTRLATHFYDVMLGDKVASQFLTHEQVKLALHASMTKWVVSVFDLGPDSDFEAMVNRQIHVGNVHARVGVPVHVVLRGARALKDFFTDLVQREIAQAVPGAPSGDAGRDNRPESPVLNAENMCDQLEYDALEVLAYVAATIDFAMEIMAGAYASSFDRSARAEESYRLFSLAQDVTAEKATQRSALLNWENDTMYRHALASEAVRLPRLGEADFGLWFKHKGAHVFQDSYETQVIIKAMDRIDQEILPVLGQRPGDPQNSTSRQGLRDLHEQVRLIETHLGRLFDERSELEAGRDTLTRLLSRRFLDVILSKEVTYARNSGTKFALLALDVDYFKDVNDNWGHDSGDMVLQQLSTILTENTRGGDYVFRMGGEEFLILLVDVQLAGALRAANKLRQQIADAEFRIRDGRVLKLTVSVGVAVHDGHPDHARILRAADDALYEAKNSGRNSVVVA